jgi:hypothetical protein
MASKKIKRDENGCPILPGSKTYGELIKPKGGKTSTGNKHKDASDYRLIVLLRIGREADRLSRAEKPISTKDINNLEFQNKLAQSPKIVQFAYHKARRDKLLKEMRDLEDSDNRLKKAIMMGAVEKEINEIEKVMEELYEEIKEGNDE